MGRKELTGGPDLSVGEKERGGEGVDGWARPKERRGRRGGVTSDFKNKIRYAPYMSFRRQASHIATNKG